MNADKQLDLIGVNRRSSAAIWLLLPGRIVALFPEWPQQRHAVRLHQPDLDPSILAVAAQILWRVAEDVLVAQLDANFRRHVGQLIEIVDLILPSSGLLGDFGEQRGSGSLFRRAGAHSGGFVNPDGVNLYVGFLYQGLDLRLAIAAAVIASVGDQQQRLARVLGLFHFMHCQVDRVQQRGSALGLGKGELVLDLLQVAREGLNQVGRIVELHQEELVLRIGQLEKLRHCQSRFVELVAHAAAAIEDHAHRERRVLAGELSDLLRLLIFRQFEVLLFESGDKAVHGVGDRDRNQYQRAVHTDVGMRPRFRLLTRFAPDIEVGLSPEEGPQVNPNGATNQQLTVGRQHSGWPAFLPQELHKRLDWKST